MNDTIQVNQQIDGDFFESLSDGNDIIYFKQDSLDIAFSTGKKHRILITHNSDVNITEDIYGRFAKCGMYDYWLAQNVCCVHDNLIPIPIGLERKRRCKFNKFDVINRCKGVFKNKPSRILYANFSLGTKIDKRILCINSFSNKEYITNKVSMYTPSNDVLTEYQYEQYCRDILDHKFVLCPCGNGIDTHRMWETLYLGRIPVVLHNPTNDSFKDMPILILNDWKEFEQHLNDNIIGNTQKLQKYYWYNLVEHILKDKRNDI